jgi:hypothetical protein
MLLLAAFILVLRGQSQVSRARSGRWMNWQGGIVSVGALVVLAGLGLWLRPAMPKSIAQPTLLASQAKFPKSSESPELQLPEAKASERKPPGAPPKPASRTNAPIQQAQPPPLPTKKITIASQEDVNPTREDAPHATKVVVHTTADIRPTWLVLRCDAEVMYAEVYMNQGGSSYGFTNPELRVAKDGKAVWFGFSEPTFRPETTLVFALSGEARIRAQSVDEERPPIDAVLIYKAGAQGTVRVGD